MKNRKSFTSTIAFWLAALMLLTQLAGVIPMEVSAASSSEIRAQIDALESKQSDIQAQIAELDSQISENLTEMQDVVAQKQIIDQEIFLLYSQIANINEQITAYGVLIADKQDELDAAMARHEELTEQNKERIRAMEEDGNLSYWSVLFKANSFADLLDRLNMIDEIAASDRRRLNELRDAAQAVADAQAALETEKAALEVTKTELDTAQAELVAKGEEADALLDNLRSRGDEYELMMAEAEANVELLMAEIAAQEAAYDAAVMEEYWATYVPPTTTAPPTTAPTEPEDTGSEDTSEEDSSDEETDDSEDSDESDDSDDSDDYDDSGDYSEGWICPVPWYVLTSPFGYRVHPIWGDWRFHSGVDLACSEGTPIYATRSGQVTGANWNDSMGYYVQINHGDGYASIYMHMTHYVVGYGEYVSQGQVIGYVGSTGDSTGDHLHFGISYWGEYVNPMEYI